MDNSYIDGQVSMFEEESSSAISYSQKLEVVNAIFSEEISVSADELFEGFDNLYAITFSYGIDFVNSIVSKFEHSEIIFGCEGLINDDVATIISMQKDVIGKYVKSKSSKDLAEKLDDGSLEVYVSRGTRSHEKIFAMSSNSGNYRVILGSANMSASAFYGLQRENITVFNDKKAFDYYMNRFETFKESCSDRVTYSVFESVSINPDYLSDEISNIPLLESASKKEYVLIEPSLDSDADYQLVSKITEDAKDLKTHMPKAKKSNNSIIIAKDFVRETARKNRENQTVKREKAERLPKLHIDFENKQLSFNGKDISLSPSPEAIESDINCLINYFQGFSAFNGNILQMQKNYYAFFNWYFASVFMPYLRQIAYQNGYGTTLFPAYGIIYGDSNGGKSTFTKLLSKMMCGQRVPLNSSTDFTATGIDSLKLNREGLPIVIDDLAKQQFKSNNEKIIKDDEWGISERLVNYPAVVITTNKLPSITPDISKRAITCHIDARINKEAGAKNDKNVNDSMKNASTALFGEYVKQMLVAIEEMNESMKCGGDYFPDIFEVSSKILKGIISQHTDSLPPYIEELTFTDYFGDRAVSKNAMEKIIRAWKDEPKQFKIDRRTNKLFYSAQNGNAYALRYIYEELPPSLNAELNLTNLVMDLDAAEELFGQKFKKKAFGR